MNNNEIIDGRTYTKAEIAEKLHVHFQTVNNYIKSGKLEAVKIGRRVLITEKAFNDYLNAYAVKK